MRDWMRERGHADQAAVDRANLTALDRKISVAKRLAGGGAIAAAMEKGRR